MFRPALLLGSIVLLASARPAAAADLVVRDAHVVDPVGEGVRTLSLLVRGGRIAAVADDPAGLPSAEGVPILDAAGRFLAPGLVDTRVYGTVQRSPGHRDSLSVSDAARLALAGGVTTVVDVFAIGSGPTFPDGARWVGGGPVVTTARGPGRDYPGARLVDRADAGRRLVESLPAGTRSLTVPIDGEDPGSVRAELLAALVEAAARRGIEPVVEISTWFDVETALSAGARWLATIPPGAMPASVRSRVAELGAALAWTPRLALGLDLADLVSQPALRDDPALARALPDTMIDDYARVRIPQTRLGEVAMRRDHALRTVGVLDSLGVRLRAGSGTGAVGTALGFSLARELRWWSEAGVPPGSILRGATDDAGAGAFDVGAPADFVVFAASPIDDPTVYASPLQVVRAGRVFEPDALSASVVHAVVEDLPENPLPFGGRVPMVLLLLVGFTLLLIVRRAIRRAAARALAEDASTD